jgi:type II secretory pathway predicted ATPase ExeA
MKREPFASDLRIEEILETADTQAVRERLHYTVGLGAVGVVTGEVGAGKSTALRLAVADLHPSEYKLVCVIATPGSINELYKQIAWELGLEAATGSRVKLMRMIRETVAEQVESRKMRPVLVVDEAQHLSSQVFSELHVITQFEQDARPMLPMILAGQTALLERLSLRCAAPLASRVVARTHLNAVTLADMTQYLNHHLKLAGGKPGLFSEPAYLAIHQGSGGFYRKANHLARGALIAAAAEKCQVISPEHVRIAASELI